MFFVVWSLKKLVGCSTQILLLSQLSLAAKTTGLINLDNFLYGIQDFDIRSSDIAGSIYRNDQLSILKRVFRQYFDALGPLGRLKWNEETYQMEAPPYPPGFSGTLEEMVKHEAKHLEEYFLQNAENSNNKLNIDKEYYEALEKTNFELDEYYVNATKEKVSEVTASILHKNNIIGTWLRSAAIHTEWQVKEEATITEYMEGKVFYQDTEEFRLPGGI